MAEYIDREKFIAEKRKQYCADCDRRKGMKRGKTVFCYEIGDAPCRSCGIGDILDDVEEYHTTDAVEVVRCRDCAYRNKAIVNKKGFLLCPASGMEITDDDYCSYGERKE